ncbi:MAG: sulfite exporter TauE/SafE family protein [Burkholderiaceae bacterium]
MPQARQQGPQQHNRRNNSAQTTCQLDTMFLLDTFSPSQLSTIAAAYLVAALVKGTTGMGYSSTCLPILTLAFGLKDALPLALIPSVASNVVVMTSTTGFTASFRRFWPMLTCAAGSVFAGLWVLTRIHSETAAAVLGAVLMVYVGFALSNARFRLDEKRTRKLEPAIGALTGFVNGLTGSQVMPLIPYLLSLDLARERFLQASNQSFTLSSVAMFLGLGLTGLMTLEVVAVSACGLVLVAVGVRIGQRIGRRLAPQAFRTAVLIVLALLGLGLILRAVGLV